MKKPNLYKGLRGLLKASAFTSVMFVMQACYGAPQTAKYNNEEPVGEPVEIHYSGTVTNEAGEPLQGITLEVNGYDEIVVTDENGKFDLLFYQDRFDEATLTFSDENKRYASFDTLVDNYAVDMEIQLQTNE